MAWLKCFTNALVTRIAIVLNKTRQLKTDTNKNMTPLNPRGYNSIVASSAGDQDSFLMKMLDTLFQMPTIHIMKTCPCNQHPLTPYFYIVKLGFTEVYISSNYCCET